MNLWKRIGRCLLTTVVAFFVASVGFTVVGFPLLFAASGREAIIAVALLTLVFYGSATVCSVWVWLAEFGRR